MFPDPPTNDPVNGLPSDVEVSLLTISLLKQYTYCPRIVYYETCTPDLRPRTYKMLAGEAAHQRERERATRRTLSAYQIPEGERKFDVRLSSSKFGLTGIVDEVVLTEDRAFVVDYKLAGWAGENHQLQLTAYALLAEEAFQRPVKEGFIYLMPLKRFETVPITTALRNSVLETIKAIHHIQLHEYMPPPVEQRRKCETCEFRRFCIDF